MIRNTLTLAIFALCMKVALGVANDHSLPTRSSRCTTEVLAKLEDKPWSIAISQNTGNIYIKPNTKPYIWVIKKGKNQTENIPHTNCRAQVLVMDNNAGKVYIGCDCGLKTYSEATGNIEDFPNISYDILFLFKQRTSPNFYLAAFYGSSVYKYESLLSEGVYLNINVKANRHFVVDSKGNYYYNIYHNGRENTQVLILKEQFKSMRYGGEDGMYFYILAVDNYGDVYGITQENSLCQLYRLEPDNINPRLLTTLDFEPCSMSFNENNDLVFGTHNNHIIVLKYPNECSYNSPTTTVINLYISNP